MAEALKRKRRYQKRVLWLGRLAEKTVDMSYPAVCSSVSSLPLDPAIHVSDCRHGEPKRLRMPYATNISVLGNVYRISMIGLEYSCIRFLAESATRTSISGRFKVLV